MNRSGFSAQLVFGISIIVLGLLFTLDNLELIEAREYLRFWPVIFILVGLAKFIQPTGTPGRVFGAGLILLGSLMVLDLLDVLSFRFWDLWPVFIILFGYNLVRGARGRRRVMEGSPPLHSDSDSYIKGFAFMGGVVRSSSSQDFRGGEVTAIMGGFELDLRRASMKEEARLEIFTFWGGVEIKVPEDWAIVVEGVPIMGGIEDKTRSPKGGATKKLVIAGNVVMGGTEISN